MFIDPIVIMRNEDFKEVVKKVLNKIKFRQGMSLKYLLQLNHNKCMDTTIDQ